MFMNCNTNNKKVTRPMIVNIHEKCFVSKMTIEHGKEQSSRNFVLK